MMIPPKLTHGDNLANLFEKFNTVIDYLREIRLVAGPGIRINRLPAGTTIESTATATGGTPGAPPQGHPFDAMIINKGTEDEPEYYVRIFNSALPDSPYAGIVIVGDWDIEIPATELKVNIENGFWVDLTISLIDGEYPDPSVPPFSAEFSLRPYGSLPVDDDTTYRVWVAEGNLPDVASRIDADIPVRGRYI